MDPIYNRTDLPGDIDQSRSNGFGFKSLIATFSIFALVVFSLLAPFSLADQKNSPPPSSVRSGTVNQQKPNVKAQKSKSAAGRITDAAVKAGILSCADRINQITNFLTAEANTGAILYQPPSDPDRRLGSISMGLDLKGGQLAYASESFAPNQVNGCGGMYETVAYWKEGCADVAKRRFSTFKQAGALVNRITVLDGGRGVKVFLMPAGTGCVAIKKEVLN